jgi:hypothetical protein
MIQILAFLVLKSSQKISFSYTKGDGKEAKEKKLV